ncbi:MAG: leucine-rich repeat protein [Mobilitalea sp.]
MRKYILRLLFLLTVSIFGVISGSTCRAASEYYFTKENQTTYKGEETFVFKDNVEYLDFNIYSEATYPEVKEIVVSEGVTYFDWNSISKGFFPNVESIYISSTVTDINSNGPYYNNQLKYLKEIKVSKDNSHYISISGCLYDKAVTKLIQYPIGAVDISYTFPDTVTTISGGAFVNAFNLQSVTIGSNIKDDQINNIKRQLAHIKEFKVDSKNSSYSAVEGVLFNKKADTLLLYPKDKGTAYKVPEGTATIKEHAFYESNLKYIKLPSSLKTIEPNAFAGCSKLITITIPKSVTNMSEFELQWLEGLQTINVESGSKLYASYDGILYDVNKTEIITVPRAYKKTTLKFPSTLTRLYLVNFNLKNATGIVIPKALKELDAYNTADQFFREIRIEAGNTNFVLYKGSLYNKDKTNLVLFKKQKKAEFPGTLKYVDVLYLQNSGITEMIIPSKTQIKGWNYNVYDISTLKKLTIDKNSQYYSMQDGLLLSKDKTILYDVPRNLKALIIPNTVKKIEASFTYYNPDLKKIVIPNSVTEISSYFLDNLKKVESIEVEQGCRIYTSLDGVLYTKDLSELVYYPINKIDKSYSMPNSVNYIKSSSGLANNPYLESIILSNMLKDVKQYALEGSKSLKEILVNKENVNYKSINGVLYNHDLTELVAYPYQKKDTLLTIPDTAIIVTGLCYLKSDWVMETVDSIEAVSNPYLETLDIGKNVKTLFKSLYNYSFWDFKNLKNFIVNKDNPYFSVRDGALYNKDCTILYLYPSDSRNTVLTIPQSVKEINEKAFEAIVSNKYLNTIIVEAGNKYFSTDGSTLSNYNGNYKYFKLGDKLYHKTIYEQP